MAEEQNKSGKPDDKDKLRMYFPEISKTGVVEKGQFRPERFFNVPFELRVVLSRKTVTIHQIESYDVGGIIPLDKEESSFMNMTVYVNGVPLYYGEVVIIDDMFGIRITHLIEEKFSSQQYLKGLDYSSMRIERGRQAKVINKERFHDVEIELRVEIGQTTFTLKKILESEIGTIIPLNKSIYDPIIIYGNNIPIFKGEIVIMKPDHIGFKINEII
jgi:flagellar motor switch/type III secretory pathway protein FliN